MNHSLKLLRRRSLRDGLFCELPYSHFMQAQCKLLAFTKLLPNKAWYEARTTSQDPLQ